MKYTIDATEKAIGRTASEVAILLMGKNDTNFVKNKVSENKVEIVNASKAKMSEKKGKTVFHETYSGYPGGFKVKSNEQIAAKKGYAELFRLAVYGMLPGNKLRPIMMKNLTIKE
ncbi:MAG: uL13 family ribosomal protein [Candidatus Pacebacteria bacterium]|jgi:large subunit ribosomal protein L13|nr:uL13 family ribosomal protein [Candidatus Paceibacterota bacterium]MBP9780445.1 uL13 family ribosomal protein [Candidatus Paceibacterota bacterium]MDQ5950052.1 large subunit ribosomal protein [Patescibacteria group bacterium]MDQ5961896.1 large subunit ribosomal protein [Patescibacteria group bacterium]